MTCASLSSWLFDRVRRGCEGEGDVLFCPKKLGVDAFSPKNRLGSQG